MNSTKSKKINKKIKNADAGFTLFVAMVVASLLLAVGFSIGNIILKQLLLAGSGKDSQVAFYAADAGAECAQFWDTKNSDGSSALGDGIFATSSPATGNISCGSRGSMAYSKTVDVPSNYAVTSFAIDYSDVSGYGVEGYRACAVIKLEKGFALNALNESVPYTKITSRGYNSNYTGASGGKPAGCDTSNPRTVERGVVVQY